ncbi:hypothetical protein [Streptacidiphilus sp. EB103A]|uniref:hypothetical protein n=1 Tax=Streptacidiphilus sp. EB103A TaxID=3156275 RepID=UPI003518BD7B
MAAVGPIRVPVHLRVSEIEYEIGHLEIDVDATPVPGDRYTISVSARSDDVRPQLAALLRSAAAHIEQGVNDAPAHE